ncbi:MFS transporter [Paenibacillus macquariensis]|uniref:MFS transporter, DHA3 family, macrolide efflux protein n=1 Tax=Paenibacillus macquariensis TaxID=948756 RepID=A0ABY1K036_9BACL|nr:MFS transporter [Paenibacillus macquariensis]MEC0091429.1 MFS transporter [Paenibacillus macquariensis]OAB38111.1 MFS transporter [Paenibacillus macquariensis subsp. macquariensis]SIR06564.1 MFS transporter, DHA3 family, macrolide efflux protein [Paenibacillus macquariensis]
MTDVALTKKPGLRELKVNNPFMLFLTAKIISRFGDSIDSIAYSWMVYLLTGSKVLMGTLFALNFVPGILFSLFTGVLVDRWNPRMIVMLADLSRGIMVIITGLLYWRGLLLPWHLFLFTFINSTFECFAMPAEMSLVPRILPKNLLLSGNSVSSSAGRIAELAGLATAGALIGLIGMSGAIIIDGLTFVISALLIACIRVPLEPTTQTSTSNQPTTYFQEFKVGLKFITSHKLLLIIMCVATFVNLCLTPFNVLNTVYVKELLHAGPIGLSILGTSLISGMLISGLWLSVKGSNFRKSVLIVSGFIILSINYALLFIPVAFPIYPLYSAAIFIFGMGIAVPLVSTPTATYLMEVTPKEMLGRVGSLFNMVCTCAMPVGSLIAGSVAEFIPVHMLYLILGGLLMIPVFFLITQKNFMKV